MFASGTQPARRGHRRQVLLSAACLALAVVATIALWPLVGPAVAHAAEGLGRIRPELLILSGALFAAAPVFCGLAWRHAILRAGGEVGRVDACARYGVGSLVNSVAPAHLGDIVRAVLLLEKLPAGGRRRIVPWFGVIQGARLAALAALALAAALPGLLIFLVLLLPGALVVATLGRGTTRLICLAFLSPLAKAAAIAVVLVGLDVGSPSTPWPSFPRSSWRRSYPSRPATWAWRARPLPERSTRRACRCRPQCRPASSCTPSRPPRD